MTILRRLILQIKKHENSFLFKMPRWRHFKWLNYIFSDIDLQMLAFLNSVARNLSL